MVGEEFFEESASFGDIPRLTCPVGEVVARVECVGVVGTEFGGCGAVDELSRPCEVLASDEVVFGQPVVSDNPCFGPRTVRVGSRERIDPRVDRPRCGPLRVVCPVLAKQRCGTFQQPDKNPVGTIWGCVRSPDGCAEKLMECPDGIAVEVGDRTRSRFFEFLKYSRVAVA